MDANERCQNGHNHKVCRCNPLKGIFNHIRVDERAIAERKWRDGLKPRKDQLPCDHGLFGDDAFQLDLVEMLMDPTND